MSRAALGIVTGSGPEAGLDLWQKLLAANRVALGDGFRGDIDAPSVIALSDPGLGLSMDLAANRDVVWQSLSRCCRKIALQVDCFAIACNTLHAFQPDIEALGLPSRFVSLVDTAVEFVSRRMLTTVALLEKNPRPNDTQIREALTGLKCRCGTHVSILRAVKRAALA